MDEQMFCSKLKFHFGLKQISPLPPRPSTVCVIHYSVGSHTCSEKRHGAAQEIRGKPNIPRLTVRPSNCILK